MFSSRSKRILSLLEPNVVNATQNNQQICQRKTKKRLKKDITAKDIPDYVALFDKGEWEALDGYLNTVCLPNKDEKSKKKESNPIEIETENKGDQTQLQIQVDANIKPLPDEGSVSKDEKSKKKESDPIEIETENKGDQTQLKIQVDANIMPLPDEELKNAEALVEVLGWDEFCRKVNEGGETIQEDLGVVMNVELADEPQMDEGQISKCTEDETVCEIQSNEFPNIPEVTGSNELTEYSPRNISENEDAIIESYGQTAESCDEEFEGNVVHKRRNSRGDMNLISDEEVESEEENIVINEVSKHADGKRYRSKRHCCKFCNTMCVAISRHLLTVHKNELEIAKVQSLFNNERKEALEQLVREGDFYYNKEVLATGKGELILVRRPTAFEQKNHTYQDYGPCTSCLGFILKKHLWHHVKYGCKEAARNENSSFRVKVGSEALLAAGVRELFSEEYEHWVIGKLAKDDIGSVCQKEELICKYGDFLFQKNQTVSPQQRGQNVRSAMRSLGSIYLKLKEQSTFHSIADILDPVKFDLIVKTVKEVCQFHNITQKGDLKSPSAAIRLGLELVKLGEFVHGLCMKTQDAIKEKKVKQFINLVKKEWNTRVSSTARSTLDQRKFNNTQLLPLTSDLMKLSTHLEKVCEQSKVLLEESVNPIAYRNLSEALLSRIILFNKRRSGESAKMKVSQFENRGKWQEETTDELKKTMSTTEKQLADRLTLIYTKGKRTHKVPVLLTDKMKEYVELLIEKRHLHGIHTENDYIFARPYPADTPLRGHDCLKKSCVEAGLTSYERISGTKLRKYIATVTQIFNLSENETDWLAKHLGHDLHVHRQFYRLHESAVELTKVSRLLLTVDQGKANKFAGKKLNEISIDELSDLEEDGPEISETQGDDGDHFEEPDHHEAEPLPRKLQKQAREDPADEEYLPEDDEYLPEDEEDGRKTNKRKKIKNNRSCIKRPWSSAEKKAVLQFFKETIKRPEGVKRKDAEECITSHSVLKGRSWLNIRDFIRNYKRKL